jgi:hypothetical protein
METYQVYIRRLPRPREESVSPWYAILRKILETIYNDRANLRRLTTLSIGEACPNVERLRNGQPNITNENERYNLSRFHLAFQRSGETLVLALPGLIPNHLGLCVVESLVGYQPVPDGEKG